MHGKSELLTIGGGLEVLNLVDDDPVDAFPRISDPLAVVLEQPVIADEPVRPEVRHLDFKVEYSPFPVPRSHP